jgi:hypothetical protein
MLSNRNIENYNKQLSRRRQKIAREVKERTAFISSDFEASKKLYGTVEIDAVKVMCTDSLVSESDGRDEDDALRVRESLSRSSVVTDHTADVSLTVDVKLSDGVAIPVTVDRERS